MGGSGQFGSVGAIPTGWNGRKRCLKQPAPRAPGDGMAPKRVIPKGSYLVDPASSHMLVSKIKPCMSKYKLLYTVKLRMAH